MRLYTIYLNSRPKLQSGYLTSIQLKWSKNQACYLIIVVVDPNDAYQVKTQAVSSRYLIQLTIYLLIQRVLFIAKIKHLCRI